MEKPKVTGIAQKELDKVEKQFDQFKDQLDSLTLDQMNKAPKEEQEPQTKLSQREIEKKNDLYLKPKRTLGCVKPFNEKFRKNWEFAKEMVSFIAENRELIGDNITLWTKPYAGIPAEEWVVPVNRPVWGPRYLAERIKGCSYHRLTMREDGPVVGSDGLGQYTGQMIADSIINRLDAHPVNSGKSVFMGASGF